MNFSSDADEVAVQTAADPSETQRRRVRFVGTERTVESDGRIRIRVMLEWQGQMHIGEAIGEESGPIEMRTTAAAAVKAAGHATNQELGVRLIGIKQVRAFDQEIMVVSLARSAAYPRHLVGAVLTTRDPHRAAALAVLNALNRILGNYLSISSETA